MLRHFYVRFLRGLAVKRILCQPIKTPERNVSLSSSAILQMFRPVCGLAVFRNRFSNDRRYPILLSSGLLTFLGLQEKTDEELESELITTIKRGVLLIQKGEFKKAEQMLHVALRLAQQQLNQDGVTYIYDLLANLAFDTEDYQKAEKLFVSVMQRLMSNGVTPDDNKMIHISLKLSKLYETTGDYKKAEEGYKYCVHHMENKFVVEKEQIEDTVLLWAMTLDWYARFLLNRNKIPEALQYFEKAYNMCIQVYGKHHEQAVVLLNDLGTVSNMLGDTDTALKYLTEAIWIGKKLPELVELPTLYINLGQLYLLKEMYIKSQEACETGLKHATNSNDKEAMSEAQHCLESLKKVLAQGLLNNGTFAERIGAM